MSKHNRHPARLLSVKYQDDGFYHVRVRFSLYAVQGVFFQELNFTQKTWPQMLQFLVNQEINGPIYVSCDWTRIQEETKDVRDGCEWLTATIGLNGTTEVLGPVHTETSFTAQYIAKNCIKVWFSDRSHQVYKHLVPQQDHLFYFRSVKGRKVYRDQTCKKGFPMTDFHRSILKELRDLNPTCSKPTKIPPFYVSYSISMNLNNFSRFRPHAAAYLHSYFTRHSRTLTPSPQRVLNACQSAFLESYQKGIFKPGSNPDMWVYAPK